MTSASPLWAKGVGKDGVELDRAVQRRFARGIARIDVDLAGADQSFGEKFLAIVDRLEYPRHLGLECLGLPPARRRERHHGKQCGAACEEFHMRRERHRAIILT